MRGEIYTWTRNWHSFGGLEALEKPFVIVVVKLDGADGARLMGILEGDTSDVAIGCKVTGRVGQTLYADRSVPAIRWSRA